MSLFIHFWIFIFMYSKTFINVKSNYSMCNQFTGTQLCNIFELFQSVFWYLTIGFKVLEENIHVAFYSRIDRTIENWFFLFRDHWLDFVYEQY